MTQDDDYEFHIDPNGQSLGLWNLYTQLTFCYPVRTDDDTSPSSQHATIVKKLTHGLETLTASFPWVAGQVTKQTKTPDDSVYLVIKPFKPIPQLTIRDHSSSLPSWDEYQRDGFPIAYLDEAQVASRNTVSQPDDSDPKPVLVVQATFVRGGLLLTFAAQHCVMDMVGEGEIIRLFSKACQDVRFTDEELVWGNCDRRALALESEKEDRSDVEDGVVPSPARQDLKSSSNDDHGKKHNSTPAPTPPKNTWHNFHFSAPSLIRLKASATASIPSSTSEFISTDDTLSALTWQRITHARNLPPATPTTLARTVDLRRTLSLPPTYPGNLATKTHTTLNTFTLLARPLGLTALSLRNSLSADLGTAMRHTRTSLLHGIPAVPQHDTDKRTRDLSRDIAMSSWAKLTSLWGVGFGLGLGRPVAVRRPGFTGADGDGMEGVVYLLPKRGDGEIVVMVCLKREDMERLKEDGVWMGFAG